MAKVYTLVLMLILLISCRETSGNENSDMVGTFREVITYHDDTNKVTCWIYDSYNKGGIDCIPDWQLKPQGGQ